MPDSLLQQPCTVVEAGDTLRSLAKGYVSNTSCVGQYQLLQRKQKEYKERMEALYGSQ